MLKQTHQNEDKLIILYVLGKIKTGLTREKLAVVIVENIQISYFDIQLLVDELVSSKLAREITSEDGRSFLSITREGRETLALFAGEIPLYIAEMLDVYLAQNKDRILSEVVVLGEYKKAGEGHYEVELSLTENNTKLMTLTLDTPSHSQAVALCEKWKDDTQALYAGIINLFSK